jgi:hypothetical protein
MMMQEHGSQVDNVPAVVQEPGMLTLKKPPVTKPQVAEMSWQAFSKGSVRECLHHGDSATLQVQVSLAQLQAANLLAVDLQRAEAVVEVRAVLTETAPHAPAGHCIVMKQFDVTEELRVAATAAGRLSVTAFPSVHLSSSMQQEGSCDGKPLASLSGHPVALSSASSLDVGAGGGNCLLMARTRHNGNVVIKLWGAERISQFDTTRADTDTKAAKGVTPLMQTAAVSCC